MTVYPLLFILAQLALLAAHIVLLLWHRRQRADFQQETVALAVEAVRKITIRVRSGWTP